MTRGTKCMMDGGAGSAAPPKNRFFTICKSSIDITGGRFKGSRSACAKKAATRLYKIARDNGLKKPSSVTFDLREVTQGSDHRVSTYTATSKKLEQPITRQINNPQDPNKPIVVTKTHEIHLRAHKTCSHA